MNNFCRKNILSNKYEKLFNMSQDKLWEIYNRNMKVFLRTKNSRIRDKSLKRLIEVGTFIDDGED